MIAVFYIKFVSSILKIYDLPYKLLMHLSMLSPRVGGAGYPREID